MYPDMKNPLRTMVTIPVVLLALVITVSSRAQGTGIKIPAGSDTTFVRLGPDGPGFIFRASVASVSLVEIPGTPGYSQLVLKDFYHGGAPGSPALPVRSIFFEADSGSVSGIRIMALDSIVIDLDSEGLKTKVVPSFPPVRKGMPPPQVQPDSAVYLTDRYTGGGVLSTSYQGIMRGVPLSLLQFRPVRYNPVQNKLIIYHKVEARIETLPTASAYTPDSRAFTYFRRRVVTRERPEHKAIRSDGPMTMVVVSDMLFSEALEPLLAWKTRRGFRVVEAYLQDPEVGGTSASIKSYLKQLYEQPPEGLSAPSYLLIVGDVDQVPASQTSGELTDLYYAAYDGEGDYIPELFYGRISVETPEQLEAVVEKIIQYETYQFEDPSFLGRNVLIAGVDAQFAPTYGNGHINYAHENYLGQDRGFETYLYRYPGSDTSSGHILQQISRGAGLVNYTGHGTYNAWENPLFSKGDIALLENAGRYPVVVGNGCETNYFAVSECFAEALLRAPGKGALAYIGCTNDSYWLEDYYWAVGVGPVKVLPGYGETSEGFYDRVFHTHGEPYESWTPSLGEMIFGGNMAVQQSNSPRKRLYWEIYQLAGDPSIVPWFGVPGDQEVTHPRQLPPGTGRIDVSCPPNSYLALSKNGLLLDAGHASPEGFSTLLLPHTLAGDTMDLVVYAEGKIPHTAEIVVHSSGDPYLDLLSEQLSNESVKADQLINPSETAGIELVFVNRGNAFLVSDTLLLQSDHPSLILLDSLVALSGVGPGDTLRLEEAFLIGAPGLLKDQDRAILEIRTAGGGQVHYMTVGLSSPVLESEGIMVDDLLTGNGNGMLEPGERLRGMWKLANTGHYKTSAIKGSGAGLNDALITAWSSSDSLVLLPGKSGELSFEFVLGSTGEGWQGSGILGAGGPDAWVEDSFRLVPGRFYENFSRGPLFRFPFENDPARSWEPDSSVHDSPGYSLRSARIGHNQATRLTISFTSAQQDSLMFSYRVSSEYGYDFLVLEVDSSQWLSWSGETGWKRYSVLLTPGFHTISWVYRKDSNTTHGEDAAWIDDIAFPAGAFRQGDIGITEIKDPVSGPWLTESEPLRLSVRNHSEEPVGGFAARYMLNGQFAGEEAFGDTLLPGDISDILTRFTFDLSVPGTYLLEVTLLGDSAAFSGNNTAVKFVEHQVFHDLSLALEGVDQVSGVYAVARLLLTNEGNQAIDSIRLEVLESGQILHAVTRDLILEPGEQAQLSVPLIDTGQVWSGGIYNFTIRSALSDNLPENDTLVIPVEWMVTGTVPEDHQTGWGVYPNPVRSEGYIRAVGNMDRKLVFQLCDLSGRVLRTYIMEDGQQTVRMRTESLVPGVYLIRLKQTGDQQRILVLPGANQ